LEKISRFEKLENSSFVFQNDLAFLGRIGKASLSKFPEIYAVSFFNIFSPISDIDLPELPDFLKPESSSTGRPLTPIQDIDLPEGFEVVMEGGHDLDSSKQEEPTGKL
jgi:hypothetical protein